MEWKMVVALIVAVGSLAATAARAQDNAAGRGATATEGQTATSDPDASGTVVDEPATVDGVPVAKPNPMSDFLKRARQLEGTEVEMPLVDDFRTDGTGTDGETK
ncbi:MAG TPA: hypothetical protein VF994_17605 [Myxococcales bacterium]